MNQEEKTIYFAKYDYRGQGKVFGIKPNDRTRHVYVIGKTGMGKSTMLENMAVQDIRNGNGMAFIDPHGATAETILSYVPEERIEDVIYFAPFDIDHPISFNVMEDVGYDKRHLVASGLMSAFKKIWQDAWSARMEYILTNTLLALLEYPESTLIDVNKMLIDKDFRKKVLEHVEDPIVKSFWVDEFAKYTDRYTQEATPAIQNKVGQFVSNPLIRNIIGQKTSSFDLRKAMDEKKILIMNLSKGRMGDVNTQLLGSMLVIKIYLAAMSRADLPPAELQKLPNFYFFVDEFQSFANETFADILSEARKYKLNLTIAHQYIEQMPEEVRDAVFGNVGTMIAFRVGAFDAEVLEKEFAPVFLAEDIVNLGFAQIYLKLMIDGLSSKPFSAVTLPPLERPEKDHREEIIAYTRAHYAKSRAEVEASIRGKSASAVSERREEKTNEATSAGKGEREKTEYRPKETIRHEAPRPAGSSFRGSAGTKVEVSRERGPRPADMSRRNPERPKVEATQPRVGSPFERTAPIERIPPKRIDAPVPRTMDKPFNKAFSAPPKWKKIAPTQPPLARGSNRAQPIERPVAARPSIPKTEKAEPPAVSLKMLQPNNRDVRSPEHLSALRQALTEVLKNENAETGKKSGEVPAEKKPVNELGTKTQEQAPTKEAVPHITATATAAHQDIVMKNSSAPRKKHRMPREEQNGTAHFRRQPPEIPENKLRKMLEVEEG